MYHFRAAVSLADIEIRPSTYDIGFERVSHLRAGAFGSLMTDEDYQASSAKSRRAFENGSALLAFYNDTLVGFTSSLRLGSHRWAQKTVSQRVRSCFRREEVAPLLSKFFTTLEFFDHPLLHRGWHSGDDDWLFWESVVDEQYRGLGIGQKMTEQRVALAAERGAKAVFVFALEGSASNRILSRVGFAPMLRYGPVYDNGLGVTFMSLPL